MANFPTIPYNWQIHYSQALLGPWRQLEFVTPTKTTSISVQYEKYVTLWEMLLIFSLGRLSTETMSLIQRHIILSILAVYASLSFLSASPLWKSISEYLCPAYLSSAGQGHKILSSKCPFVFIILYYFRLGVENIWCVPPLLMPLLVADFSKWS